MAALIANIVIGAALVYIAWVALKDGDDGNDPPGGACATV